MAVPTVITDISTTAASNSPAGSDSIGNPGTIDDYFRGYGAVFRAETLNKTWERWGDTPTYIGATQFSVTGDKTSRYVVGRRIKATVTAGTVYGRISASVFGAVTTVTIVADSGSLDSGLSEVQLGPETYGLPTNSAGLAALLSDETGTGNAVFSASPTFSGTPTLTDAVAIWVANRSAAGAGKYSFYRWNTAGTIKWQAGIDGDVSDSRWCLYSFANSLYTLNVEADGRVWGSSLHNNAGAVTGTTNQYIASGTYTPTVSNTTNISANTPHACQWMRVGNVVTVSGTINITPSSATGIQFQLSLPIASNIANTFNLAGAVQGGTVGTASSAVVGSAANDTAVCTANNNTTSDTEFCFHFTYVVL